MAKEINHADIEPQIDLIKQINIGTVQKVIARAEREALAAGTRQQRAVKRVLHQGKLGRTLDKAMSFHGRSARGQPSIRLKAPDTGGRPFHFGFTVVTKGVRAKKGSGRAGAAGSGAGAQGQAASSASPGSTQSPGSRQSAQTMKGRNRRQRASTGEGAHQLYTERDAAIDIAQPLDGAFVNSLGPDFQIDPGIGLDPADRTKAAREEEIDTPGRSQEQRSQENERTTAQQWVEEGMSLTPGLSERSSEAAAQRYIEDPSKLPKLRGHTSSFGTIGDTVEERLRFWELVHEHESDKGAHTQSRLVLELPHEASAVERHEIVRTFTDKAFRAKGLPYWVSIHAPTKENDWRNHHAHVVFSERPAKKIIDSATGKEEWDFAITGKRIKKSRNVVVTHPYRQVKNQDFRKRGWVKSARAQFSNTVNEVMERAGKGRLYDARSYKDMGLDASPMKNISRILADKTKTHTFVVMDAAWTRKMIDEEIRDAAIRRDATFQALVKTESMLVEGARSAGQAAKVQGKLPQHLRMGPTMLFGTNLANKITTNVLETERERLAQQFVNEATERALKHVIEATSPRPKARGKGRVHDTTNAPDPEDLLDLHTAATQELVAHRLATSTTRARISSRMRELRKQWNRHENRPAEDTPIAPAPARSASAQSTPEPATTQAPTKTRDTTAGDQTRTTAARSTSTPTNDPTQDQSNERREATQPVDTAVSGRSTKSTLEPQRPTPTQAAAGPRRYRGLRPLSAAAARMSSAMGAAIDMVGDISPENVKSAMRMALDAMGSKEAAMRAALREMEREDGPLIPRTPQRPQTPPQPTTQAPPAPASQTSSLPPGAAEQSLPAPTAAQEPMRPRPPIQPATPTWQLQPAAEPGLPFIPPRDPRPLTMRIITEHARPSAPAATHKPEPAQTRPTAPQTARPEITAPAVPQQKEDTRAAPKPRKPETSQDAVRLPSSFDSQPAIPGQTPLPLKKTEEPESKQPNAAAALASETPEFTPEQIVEKNRKARRRAVLRAKGRGGFER